ncbi:hypothetical protein ACIP98_07045 [Streptomyces sp. NPDC088354]|uniref:hypothetical protein n=1 Tax=Streptomyces sp. NPDC088354 TaxID=3365856 RepID=UPI00381702AD
MGGRLLIGLDRLLVLLVAPPQIPPTRMAEGRSRAALLTAGTVLVSRAPGRPPSPGRCGRSARSCTRPARPATRTRKGRGGSGRA